MEHDDGANCVIVQQGLFQRHTHRSSSGSDAEMTGGPSSASPACLPACLPSDSINYFGDDDVTLLTTSWSFGHRNTRGVAELMTLRQFHRGGLGECVVESPYRSLITHLCWPRQPLLLGRRVNQQGALRSNLAPGSSLNPAILTILGDLATWLFLFAFLVTVSWERKEEGRL